MGEALVSHIPTKKNLADLFTKVLYGPVQRFLVSQMLRDVFKCPCIVRGKGCS